ncbi:MAG: DUF1641 domain-containing protein [Deltaproteobacteria bacterium]|nr:MAG: DUF1641 domain-containing protein [Deltaproteobacteria bacterium]
MDNNAEILERLDQIEAQLAPLVQSFKGVNELRKDMAPVANSAIRLLIDELEDVESSFQLEDLMEMVKEFMRSVRYITWSMKQMKNLIDFLTTLEPLLNSSVPQMINYLDDWEQRGVFRIINATLGVRAKIAEAYTPEDIEQIGDGLVILLGLAKKITSPQSISFLQGMAEIPTKLDLKASRKVGPFGLMWALRNKEVKEGIGVMLELTKEMGKLRDNAGAESEAVSF